MATTKRARSRRKGTRYWSSEVTRRSDALDGERGVFRQRDPRRVALSLKRSAEASTRRKGTPYQSAMSMLTFYLNRAGKNVTAKQRRVLERAKSELRAVFRRA
jgi:putative cell wall-binding protein